MVTCIQRFEVDIDKVFSPYSNEVISMKWVTSRPSIKDCIVLNVNGSCLVAQGRVGAWGIIRGSDGSWIIGFRSLIGTHNITLVQLMALFVGLKLARLQGLNNICYNSILK